MNTTYRYLKWDGLKKEFDFHSQDLLQEFANFLMEGWSPEEAFEWILKQGIHGSSIKVMGIDDLRSEFSKFREAQFNNYNLHNSLSEIQKELSKIVDEELSEIRKKLSNDTYEYRNRANLLENLPKKISSAVGVLSNYDFLSTEAKNSFRELKKKLNQIMQVESFINRYGDKFRGKHSIGFDETLDLIGKFEEIETIEHNLISGAFDRINLENLRGILSEQGYNSFIFLKDLKPYLENSGLIRKTPKKIQLTPKGIRKIGERALRDIFSSMKKHQFGGHETTEQGFGTVKPENSKEYEFGDPFNLNVVGTLKNSLLRRVSGNTIKVEPEDFKIYDMEYHTQSTTAVLLDLSWSMSFQGRFPAAKRVALALDHLIRTRYPRDNFYIVGFSTRARVLSTDQLVKTTWDSNDPFTNIQEALKLATRLIRKHRTPNRQIILITDGQPTAYFLDGYLQVELPMFFGGLSPRATFETLKEVKNLTRQGITINTFMLDDSSSLRRFVEDMTRINKGRAFFTTPTRLGRFLLVDYLKRKRRLI
jgi:uncharacterized protein with von Willebrand factor type A (vWA) domain